MYLIFRRDWMGCYFAAHKHTLTHAQSNLTTNFVNEFYILTQYWDMKI